jgi:hypothetical protein
MTVKTGLREGSEFIIFTRYYYCYRTEEDEMAMHVPCDGMRNAHKTSVTISNFWQL